GETVEAKLAKGFDKLETILQHTQGQNPSHFDYDFNLTYGSRWTEEMPLLRALRALVDEATARRAKGDEAWP
ncbi:MAG: phosphohydrolase, partial [Pseudomonadota bacterium]